MTKPRIITVLNETYLYNNNLYFVRIIFYIAFKVFMVKIYINKFSDNSTESRETFWELCTKLHSYNLLIPGDLRKSHLLIRSNRVPCI